MNTYAHLVESICKSPMFQEYQRAFSEATGLSISLRAADERNAAPTCSLLPFCARTCSNQLKGTGCASEVTGCPFKLAQATVPVRLGQQVIGFLVTARVAPQQPTEMGFEQGAAEIRSLGSRVNQEKMREAYFQTHVVPEQTLESLAKLLSIFAEHIALKSNELAIRQANIEPVAVVRVKEFIRARYREEVTLADAAQAANTSTFHLCKLFRKATGMCFTEYLSRTRVESAKELLLRPNLRISEIAFEVGFQSLTHFNRVFRKLVGESPTEYRAARSALALAA